MRVLFEKNGETHIVETTCVRTCHEDSIDGIAFKALNAETSEKNENEWYFAEIEDYVAEEIIISTFSTGLMDLRAYPVE